MVVINQDIVRHFHQVGMREVKDAGTLLAYLSGYIGASGDGEGMGAVDCMVIASLIDEWLEKERVGNG
jgi:hypothetical protein